MYGYLFLEKIPSYIVLFGSILLLNFVYSCHHILLFGSLLFMSKSLEMKISYLISGELKTRLESCHAYSSTIYFHHKYVYIITLHVTYFRNLI
jgi:hypothetical protein